MGEKGGGMRSSQGCGTLLGSCRAKASREKKGKSRKEWKKRENWEKEKACYYPRRDSLAEPRKRDRPLEKKEGDDLMGAQGGKTSNLKVKLSAGKRGEASLGCG